LNDPQRRGWCLEKPGLRDDDDIALTTFQGFPEKMFAPTSPVGIGGVEDIDALVNRGVQRRLPVCI
jgi:hypothetical protein